LLRSYLSASTDPEVDACLAIILDELAKPIVRRIVASTVRDAPGANDAEDVVSDTLADLLRRLRDLRREPANPIHDLRGYIVTCAYNRCHERLRERYPARNRLRNHLHYLFGHHAELALWKFAQHALVCGLREWEGRAPASDDRAERLSLPARTDPTAENRRQINTLVFAALRNLGAPIELDAFVDAIARIIDLDQQRVELPLTESESFAAPSVDEDFDIRMALRELWDDIGKLSQKQRMALLLNLRDAHGRESLSLLLHTRTATVDEIADVVGIPKAHFAQLWNELPLSDAAIAELLGITPRQVIKLRRLARERLRRMAGSREKLQSVRDRRNPAPDSDSSLTGPAVQTNRR
ncbi:MAG: hypothetical protein ACLGH0_04335, partial [Thermoanaerobaculia bacterium]